MIYGDEHEYEVKIFLEVNVVVCATSYDHAVEKAKERIDKGDFEIEEMDTDSVEKLGPSEPEREYWEDR